MKKLLFALAFLFPALLQAATPSYSGSSRFLNPSNLIYYAAYVVATNTTNHGFIVSTNGINGGWLRVIGDQTNSATLTATDFTANNLNLAGAGDLFFTTRIRINTPSSGVLTIRNSGGTDFGRLQLGGTTDAFTSIQRTNTDVSIRTAGDGNFGSLNASNVVAAGRIFATNGQNIVAGPQIRGLNTLAFSGGTNVTVNWSLGNHFVLEMTNNAKLWFTNAPGAGLGQMGVIDIRQDASGNRLLYWDNTNLETNSNSGMVLSTSANAKDKLFVSTDHTGTNFQVVLHKNFQK